MVVALFLAVTLAAVISLVAARPSLQGFAPVQRARRWVNGLTLFLAAGPSQQEQSTSDPYASLAAALAAGVACIGAGLAVSSTGSAAIGTIAERPETFGRALIFVGLAEGIAIYGLIIAFMILSR